VSGDSRISGAIKSRSSPSTRSGRARPADDHRDTLEVRTDAWLADVHALAKILWLLLADQNLPLSGPHRAEDDAYRLTARLRHRWAAQLDRLIERCTDHDPARRLSLREVADELTAMLTPTAEAAVPDVDDLERRLATMAEPRRRQDERRDSFRALLTRAWDRIVAEVAEPAYEALAARLPDLERRYDSNVGGPRALIHIPSIQIGDDGWGSSILAPGGGRGSTPG
jgi:hypothetical protein